MNRQLQQYWIESSGGGGGAGGGGGIAGLIRGVFVLSVFACLSRPGRGQTLPCTDETDEPLPFLKAVLLSRVILYGKVLRTHPDPRYHHGRVYTAEMEVYCAIKGGQTLRHLNITDAGLVPGICFSAELHPMSKYVLLAEFDGAKYRPVDTEKPGTGATLEEVAKACDVDPKYPVGVDPATAEFRCPIPSPPGDCVDIDYFTTTTTTTTTAAPPTEDDYDYDYITDGPIPVDVYPVVDDLLPGSSSKPPQLTTSTFSTSVADLRLIPSVRLLSILALNLLLLQVLGPYLDN